MTRDTRAGAITMKAAAPTTRRRTRRQATALRFPCGHQEPETSVLERMREREHALWITCRRCNVLVVVVDR